MEVVAVKAAAAVCSGGRALSTTTTTATPLHKDQSGIVGLY
jgi:hypothetical protein